MADTISTSEPYVVKRNISFVPLNGGQQLSDLLAALAARQGMIDVSADPRRSRLRIRYDVKQLLFDDVVQILSSHGLAISTDRWMRLKGNWYRMLDENARGNANSKGGACCSNPTEIYARRNRRS